MGKRVTDARIRALETEVQSMKEKLDRLDRLCIDNPRRLTFLECDLLLLRAFVTGLEADLRLFRGKRP